MSVGAVLGHKCSYFLRTGKTVKYYYFWRQTCNNVKNKEQYIINTVFTFLVTDFITFKNKVEPDYYDIGYTTPRL